MEKYLRRVSENRHFNGFVAGVITSTITFSLLSSMLIYSLSSVGYVDNYEFDYRGYDNDNDNNNFRSGRKIMETQTSDSHLVDTQTEAKTENVVLNISEHYEVDKEGVIVDASSTSWPTFHAETHGGYFP
jgi:hypothetical protein